MPTELYKEEDKLKEEIKLNDENTISKFVILFHIQLINNSS